MHFKTSPSTSHGVRVRPSGLSKLPVSGRWGETDRLWGAKVNLQGMVGLLHFYSQDVRPKVADETLRKREPDHRRADQADAPQQQPETEPARCEAKLTAQTARTHRQDAGNQPQDQNEPEQESPRRRQSVRTRYPGGP